VSSVDFIIKIQEVKAQEREDALFQCVLTHPVPKITWLTKGRLLEDGEKYTISVSEHKLIHRLLIKDCQQLDRGIYSAVAGIVSCSAWLLVDAGSDPSSAGKKKIRKTTLAVGVRADLERVAKEQQMKNQREMENILAAIKAKQAAQQKKEKPGSTSRTDEEIDVITRRGTNSGAVKKAARSNELPESIRPNEETKVKNTTASASKLNISGDQLISDQPKKKKQSKADQVDPDKLTESSTTGSNFELNQTVVSAISQTQLMDSDGNEELSESIKDESDSNENEEDFVDWTNDSGSSKQDQHPKDVSHGESPAPQGQSEIEEANVSSTPSTHKRQSPLSEDLVIDSFIYGLSDVDAIIGETAELTCKLSSNNCEGAWFRYSKKVFSDDSFTITKDGAVHKLVISKCNEEHSGKYRFEADGCKTEAMVNVKDPPRFEPDDLSAFTHPLTLKVEQNAAFKLHFLGHEPIKIQWYREGEELHDDTNTNIETSGSHSSLLPSRCQRKDTGDIKIKLRNEHGFIEAISHLIVLDKPTPPLGPVEVIENSTTCIEFKWRPPKDDNGSPVIKYILERQQTGQSTWKKLGEIPGVPTYCDRDVERGHKYYYRIRAVTGEGTSEAMKTDEMQAGILTFPGPPAPPKVVSAFDSCINLSWTSPNNTGGSRILGYILEKRKKGSNRWTVVNTWDELIKEKNYAVKDVVAGMEYEIRVTAINLSGVGEFSNPSEFVFARDPKKPPGKVTGLKVTETSYNHMALAWTKPEEKIGQHDEAKGYFVEIRSAECTEWSRCNNSPVISSSFTVKGIKPMDAYLVRVIATNDGGDGDPQELLRYVIAMPSPVRPRFTNHKMKSFMVVRAGNSVRITVSFEASPRPEISWLKDNVAVTKRVTVSNSDGSSQLLIPSSEHSDSGIYSILVKNLVGQETFSTEVSVTDDPKPPRPVELEENVPGTVSVKWEPSPDEKHDNRLHYSVSTLDSTKSTWTTVADKLFNNKFTVCNIIQGHWYHFRVYAKNDMGISAPLESPTWGTEKKKERVAVSLPIRKLCDLRCAPSFIVPLKLHTVPKGYECYMSCAVKGNPLPRITWYRNNLSLNTNTNYYISNTSGVCSMLVLCMRPKDTGEYVVRAENMLGRAECSTVLSVTE
ncbi:immunoglobulin-like and fibronectin type III domain-containing protein 1, partial [Thalassophryne amazonica]|uniref:immunoglobulin-like and fibronectin type III domain-containing protein 1 n=1 Tax=Thalassophryne amazonica TaxID=390379 RepID=UPI001471F5A1